MVSDKEGLELALEQAYLAEQDGEVPVGAVIVKDNRVIASAFNTKEQDCDPTGHAEIRVIQEAAKKVKNWRLSGCTLFVTLEPCPMCLAACQQARVERVVFGAIDKKGGAISLGVSLHEDRRTNHLFQVDFFENLSCGKVLTDFFRKKRKGGD